MDFVKYAQRNKSLLRHYPGFLIYLAGGMAVKLYLMQLGVKPSEKVAKTKDYDFVFAVNHHLSDKEIRQVFIQNVPDYVQLSEWVYSYGSPQN
jgi:hypothetical protein